MTTSDLSLRSGRRLAARSVAIDGPVDLLDHHAPGGFVWIDGDHGFVTAGVAARVAPEDAASFLAGMGHSCAGAVSEQAGPRAVGALPFAGTGELIVPTRIIGRDARGHVWSTVVDDADADAGSVRAPGHAATGPAPSEFAVRAVTTRAEWQAMVEDTLVDIASGRLEKLVLAAGRARRSRPSVRRARRARASPAGATRMRRLRGPRDSWARAPSCWCARRART